MVWNKHCGMVPKGVVGNQGLITPPRTAGTAEPLRPNKLSKFEGCRIETIKAAVWLQPVRRRRHVGFTRTYTMVRNTAAEA